MLQCNGEKKRPTKYNVGRCPNNARLFICLISSSTKIGQLLEYNKKRHENDSLLKGERERGGGGGQINWNPKIVLILVQKSKRI